MPYIAVLAALFALFLLATTPQSESQAGPANDMLAFDDEVDGDTGDDEESGSADLDGQDDGDSDDDDDDDSANGPSDLWDTPEFERGTSA